MTSQLKKLSKYTRLIKNRRSFILEWYEQNAKTNSHNENRIRWNHYHVLKTTKSDTKLHLLFFTIEIYSRIVNHILTIGWTKSKNIFSSIQVITFSIKTDKNNFHAFPWERTNAILVVYDLFYSWNDSIKTSFWSTMYYCLP